MKRQNAEIRDKITKSGLTYWQVAEQLGIHATTFTVWLRAPLSANKEKRISEAIEVLSHETTAKQ